ncbi:hypothetical protein HC341_08855 [Aquisalimonas sp. 2447]|uniref:hypothetical protein n=1 Tax=Aquisalimonas sp. 2447 TaxID=2740807 RepID=UPI00143247DB|nr:hypothetical protein [Aquisalimonas sp. 2447]QIT55302.1 hypothetical protein HC341_08855 [Aquisalimonas sp. 2447]
MNTLRDESNKAQALRKQRLGWGFAAQACLFLILTSAAVMGQYALESYQTPSYSGAYTAFNTL